MFQPSLTSNAVVCIFCWCAMKKSMICISLDFVRNHAKRWKWANNLFCLHFKLQELTRTIWHYQRCSWEFQAASCWSGKESSSMPEMAKLEQTDFSQLNLWEQRSPVGGTSWAFPHQLVLLWRMTRADDRVKSPYQEEPKWYSPWSCFSIIVISMHRNR